MLTGAPRGTKDILPASIMAWRYVEQVMREVCAIFDYHEIRTPMFEHTELFHRGIGDTTDVVEKEMYTFTDRGARSLTLRPENTASVVRAFVENKMYGDVAPTKLYYIGPMFRYDRPQAGRMRQFHQFGIEALGASSPIIDAEVIMLALQVLKKLGLTDLKLKINSVGCGNCRPVHRKLLQDFFRPNLQKLCRDCQNRFERNPLRILDCKVPECKQIAVGAPKITDCLCDECSEHFAKVQELLNAAGVEYEIDSNLVRGLDYYTKTAFEIQYSPLGAQSAVCGGGRYDGLVEELGGPSTPGIGFAMGMERVLLALTKQNLLPEAAENIDIFVVVPDTDNLPLAFKTLNVLRACGLPCDMDFLGRSMKAQMKQANRLKAHKVIIFGEEEVARGVVVLRDMDTSEQNEVQIEDLSIILNKTEVQKHE
ncbi:MAG: histidine--tRNA ligase [Acidaminococcaceae bacterium]|nr:histidine--tRNA ligase [Acidaminococcaceae bacterium]MDD4721205.1 histidine--tRNA ligase [Acidaminococcaceae bacterium]